jgi:hypothetical protein
VIDKTCIKKETEKNKASKQVKQQIKKQHDMSLPSRQSSFACEEAVDKDMEKDLPPTFSLWDLVPCLCKMLPVACWIDEAATSSSFYGLLVQQD